MKIKIEWGIWEDIGTIYRFILRFKENYKKISKATKFKFSNFPLIKSTFISLGASIALPALIYIIFGWSSDKNGFTYSAIIAAAIFSIYLLVLTFVVLASFLQILFFTFKAFILSIRLLSFSHS